jgi:signal peptidase I
VKSLSFILLIALAGCSSVPNDRALVLRARLPVVTSVAYTYSMYPVLSGGETIRITHKDFKEVKPYGEMVVFWPAWSPTPIIHQTAGHQGSLLITKGVNCVYPDPGFLDADNYIGSPLVIEGGAGPLPPKKGMSLFTSYQIP